MLDSNRDKGAEEKELFAVCETLWNDHVRNDLVFTKNLQLCLSCMAFFYASADADHPKDQVVAVQRFFSDQAVTSLAKLVDFMKDSIHRSTLDGSKEAKTLRPSFNHKHQATALKSYHMLHDQTRQLMKEHAADVQAQLASTEEVINVLREEVERLCKANEDMMVQLFRYRERQSHAAKLVTKLLDQIATIVGGCNFACDCQHEETHAPSK